MASLTASLLVVIFVAVTALELDPRGGSLVTIGGQEYFVSDDVDPVSQADSMAKCEAMGMKLLSIQTASENSLLIDYCINADCYFRSIWTSGDKIGTNLWMWNSTGEVIDYFAWTFGQPDNDATKTGIVFYPEIGWFNAAPTTIYNNYICEPAV